MRPLTAPLGREKTELARVQGEHAKAAALEAELKAKMEEMESDALRERGELERMQKERAAKNRAEQELRDRMDQLRDETEREKR